MEKIIEIIMNDNESIGISVNGEMKHTIVKENRSLLARELYDIINFAKGNTYVVISENASNYDVAVLDFFKSLLSDIVEKVNKLND